MLASISMHKRNEDRSHHLGAKLRSMLLPDDHSTAGFLTPLTYAAPRASGHLPVLILSIWYAINLQLPTVTIPTSQP
ncbi:hypothetical protein N7474_005133 [Penicillium riverlandense]|uniref:uncharacterized protein n=1 Tax=Penicillium riverlandense TaxID=1903569 RepID=UPI002546F1DB|nr:uncharacterized protein N7474_005133 [Penicillium riverlandense]KAJ5819542.1 hypothetical protein N7474_005133 [Penicillium riverlandense]